MKHFKKDFVFVETSILIWLVGLVIAPIPNVDPIWQPAEARALRSEPPCAETGSVRREPEELPEGMVGLGIRVDCSEMPGKRLPDPGDHVSLILKRQHEECEGAVLLFHQLLVVAANAHPTEFRSNLLTMAVTTDQAMVINSTKSRGILAIRPALTSRKAN